ncbi:hypothetical protein [Pseudomonas entomophila]|uniref:hypothetical protein n=1 Tax=Pseudomonas entomophila TaxID=312306 RepID=UPI001F0235B4|nr:hypothetical protein [Pseudomonas entomophila]MCG8293134.1 hypothetical protein [Pseudomonas entomophila]
MMSNRMLLTTLMIACLASVVGLTQGCSKAEDTPQVSAGIHTPSKLGDLGAFRAIAQDVAAKVRAQDLPGAKTRIKDLEKTWDDAEAGIKPRAASDWHLLDKAIDHSLDALRAGQPSQADCQAALDDLLKVFDALQGPRQG